MGVLLALPVHRVEVVFRSPKRNTERGRGVERESGREGEGEEEGKVEGERDEKREKGGEGEREGGREILTRQRYSQVCVCVCVICNSKASKLSTWSFCPPAPERI